MLLTVSLLLSIVSGAMGALLFRTAFGSLNLHRPIWLAVFIVATTAGAAIQVSETRQLSAAWDWRSWPTVEGTVVATEVSGRRAFHPEIHYEYHVDGRVYRGMSDLDVPGFGTKSSRLNVAERTAAEYPIGRLIIVHYDPAMPATSRIRITPSFSTFLLLTIGILLAVAGATGLLGAGLRKVRHPN